MAEPIQVRGADWIRVALRQRAEVVEARGVVAGSGVSGPATDGVVSLRCFLRWNAAVPAVLRASDLVDGDRVDSIEGDGLFLTDDAFEAAFAGTRGIVLTRAPVQVLLDGGISLAARQSVLRVDQALRTMLDAMAKGFDPGTRSNDGALVLDAINAARYWEAVVALGRELSFLAATGIAIPFLDKLEAAGQGAKEGVRNVGRAAGAALALAGEAAGAAGAGFLEGLGLVNVVVIAGGAYVATKVL